MSDVETNKKNYECNECDKQFDKNWQFYKHRSKVHKSEKQKNNSGKDSKYQCTDCKKKYVRKKKLDLHMEKKHNDQDEDMKTNQYNNNQLDLHMENIMINMKI